VVRSNTRNPANAADGLLLTGVEVRSLVIAF